MNTMESLITSYTADSWIESLPMYQKDVIQGMYQKLTNYDLVAQQWLNSSIPLTVPFGGRPQKNIFWENIVNEVELFVKGDEKYAQERAKLLGDSSIVQYTIVSIISSAIGSALGNVAAALIAPVVATVFFSICKIGLNAWLVQRESQRTSNKDDN